MAGILVWATWCIGRANIKGARPALIGVAAAVALFLKADALLVLLGCGLLGILLSGHLRALVHRGAGMLAAVGLWLGSGTVQTALPRALELSLVFLKVGTVIFGGGFGAIPFLQQEVVTARGWLSAREFIDCVALGQLTPGPVAIMSAFIGYKVSGLPGAVLATLGTFLPSTFMLIGLIRVYQRVSRNPLVTSFLSGVMPAVTGMLLSAAFSVGKVSITGILPALMMLLSLALLVRFRVDPIWVIAGGALIGLLAS
ncbi:MAG: chromate transporter [candidate division WOR-3 bacterium]